MVLLQQRQIYNLDIVFYCLSGKFLSYRQNQCLTGGISSFQQQYEESIPEAWEFFQATLWNGKLLPLQTFYHRLSTNTRETMDAAAGGALLSLTLTRATDLVEKMASNQAWNEKRQPLKKERGMHQLKEVDMMSAKMDLLLRGLKTKPLRRRKSCNSSNPA
jgi:hypothetical protein